MKQVIFNGLRITVLMLAVTINSFGQASHTAMRFSDKSSTEETKPASNSVSRNTINSKVLRNFSSSYKEVSDEKWYKVPGGTIAMFTLSNIDYSVRYDKQGAWANTIRTYDEDKLPKDIRHEVKSMYYDYNINLVQEIESPFNPLTYVIQLVGKTEIINLKVCEGEMSVLTTLSKSE
jgi:hypothetical protein